jgi:hypothetical protein
MCCGTVILDSHTGTVTLGLKHWACTCFVSSVSGFSHKEHSGRDFELCTSAGFGLQMAMVVVTIA